MDLLVDDATFIRAPVGRVYDRMRDIASWPSWFPGLDLKPLPPIGRQVRWAVGLRVSAASVLRFSMVVHRPRYEAGFELDVTGDLLGDGEFWFEPQASGVVVHHLMKARIRTARSARAARGYRKALRTGMWGLKDEMASGHR